MNKVLHCTSAIIVTVLFIYFAMYFTEHGITDVMFCFHIILHVIIQFLHTSAILMLDATYIAVDDAMICIHINPNCLLSLLCWNWIDTAVRKIFSVLIWCAPVYKYMYSHIPE